MRRIFWLSSFLMIIVLFFVRAVIVGRVSQPAKSAQESTPLVKGLVTDDEVNAIARELYCPVCENTPLDVCPTQACAEWRELIREKLTEGWTKPQIEQYFVERFGDRVLATPPPRGLNWLVYVVPPLAFLTGVFLLYRAIKTWRQPTSLAMSDTPPQYTGDEYIDRVEEELRRL